MNNNGSSKLYRKLGNPNEQISYSIYDTRKNKLKIEIERFGLSTSFLMHHSMYQDPHLKYIQLRTLHKRFYTNGLSKNGYKNFQPLPYAQHKRG